MYPNLKLQLWISGIRQNRFAKMLGTDETQLSKIVNGFRQPSSEMRSRIALLLQSDEEWLFRKVDGKSDTSRAVAARMAAPAGNDPPLPDAPPK
jgi:transcriptional regulator with XRE-family HTH domain